MNWVAIVIATAVNMALGALLFPTLLFLKPWVALVVANAPMSGGAEARACEGNL